MRKKNDKKLAGRPACQGNLLSNLIMPKQKQKKTQNHKRTGIATHARMNNNDVHYKLTPKGLLWSVLGSHYGPNLDFKKFERFQRELVAKLSLLSTENQNSQLLGEDFNDFFSLVVTSMNCLEKAIAKLNDNGIKCDIQDLLDSGNDNDGN